VDVKGREKEARVKKKASHMSPSYLDIVSTAQFSSVTCLMLMLLQVFAGLSPPLSQSKGVQA